MSGGQERARSACCQCRNNGATAAQRHHCKALPDVFLEPNQTLLLPAQVRMTRRGALAGAPARATFDSSVHVTNRGPRLLNRIFAVIQPSCSDQLRVGQGALGQLSCVVGTTSTTFETSRVLHHPLLLPAWRRIMACCLAAITLQAHPRSLTDFPRRTAGVLPIRRPKRFLLFRSVIAQELVHSGPQRQWRPANFAFLCLRELQRPHHLW